MSNNLANIKFDDVQNKPSFKPSEYNMYYLDYRYNSITKIKKIKQIKNSQTSLFETVNGYKIILNSKQYNTISYFYLNVWFKKFLIEIEKTDSLKTRIKKVLTNIIESW